MIKKNTSNEEKKKKLIPEKHTSFKEMIGKL